MANQRSHLSPTTKKIALPLSDANERGAEKKNIYNSE
jgi:hypothetical protein